MAYFITKDKKILTKVTLVFITFNRYELSYLILPILNKLLSQNFLDTRKMRIREQINSKTSIITSIVFVHIIIIIINTSIQHMLL